MGIVLCVLGTLMLAAVLAVWNERIHTEAARKAAPKMNEPKVSPTAVPLYPTTLYPTNRETVYAQATLKTVTHNCGYVNWNISNYCGNCGEKLKPTAKIVNI